MKKMQQCLFSLLLILLLSGCGIGGGIYSNYRVLESLQLVTALGFDLDEQGQILLTAVTAAIGDSEADMPVSATGSSIPDAIRHLQDASGRGELFFAHMEYLLAGQRAGWQSLKELLDYVKRDVQTRLDAQLFLCADGDAQSLLRNAADNGDDPSEVLASLSRDLSMNGAGKAFTLRETALSLAETGAAVVSLLELGDTGGIVPAGLGILQDSALTGVLTVHEAEALGLFLNWPGSVTRAVAQSDGRNISFQLFGKGDIRPDSDNTVTLSLKAEAAVAGKQSENGDMDMNDALALLRGQLETDLDGALKKSAALSADFLNLSGIFRRSGIPLASDWLQNLTWRIAVEVNLSRNYDLRGEEET